MPTDVKYNYVEGRENSIDFIKKHPWDFHSEIETSKNYLFFEIYKNLGVERSLKKVEAEAQKLKKIQSYKLSTLKDLSTKGNWKQRAEAWDLYKLQEWTKSREERVHEMCTSHIKDAQNFHKKIMYEMDQHAREVPTDKKAYYYDAMTRAYERMARLERVSNGEVVEFDGLRLDTDYTAKDLDKLLKDPELTGDLTTLMSRVDDKLKKFTEDSEDRAEKDRAEKDRADLLKEEFEDLYDEDKTIKKKEKEWWE